MYNIRERTIRLRICFPRRERVLYYERLRMTGREGDLRRKFMDKDINLQILDRFRHVGRMLRVADAPCQKTLSGADAGIAEQGGYPASDTEKLSSAGVLKRDVVLPFLLCSKDGLKQKEIADEIRVSPSTISEMLSRLVDDGYVERKPDADDRRVKRLCLTEKGRERAEYMLGQITEVLDGLFVNLETGEKEELIRLLDKLVGNDSERI